MCWILLADQGRLGSVYQSLRNVWLSLSLRTWARGSSRYCISLLSTGLIRTDRYSISSPDLNLNSQFKLIAVSPLVWWQSADNSFPSRCKKVRCFKFKKQYSIFKVTVYWTPRIIPAYILLYRDLNFLASRPQASRVRQQGLEASRLIGTRPH